MPVENSLVFASKLKECGVKFELHVFEEGGSVFRLLPTKRADLTSLYKSG